jgi:hypothetical protein
VIGEKRIPFKKASLLGRGKLYSKIDRNYKKTAPVGRKQLIK